MSSEKAATRIGRTLSDGLGWPDAPWERVAIAPTATGLATWMPIADLAAAAQGLVGLSAAALHQARGGPEQSVSVDRFHTSLSMTAAEYCQIDGTPIREWNALTRYFRAADGWVYCHAAFPHLRAGLIDEFGGSEDPTEFGAALAGLPAQEIEDRAQARGLCAIRRRDRTEWQDHPQSAALRAQPLIAVQPLAGEARDLPPKGTAPMEGVRVLDLSRVIAGPMIGRTLAEHGADVLRIGSPKLPSLPSLVVDTGFGKRSAFVDLETDEGRTQLARLVLEADVLIDGYRPGALAARGFGIDELRALNPAIVYLTLSAFGESGPWAGRRGYDTYVQAATGLSMDGPDGPGRLPCQPLDYLTGYLGAAAIMTALRRRIAEGGAWRLEMSLARNAEWVWEWTDALGAETAPPETNADDEAVRALTREMPSQSGLVRALGPAVSLSRTPPFWRSAPVPLGTHAPEWL